MSSPYKPIVQSKSLTLIETVQAERADSSDAKGFLKSYRSESNFVAHLLAVKLDVPMLRAKRRATPSEAITAYTAISAAKAYAFVKRAA